MPSTDSMLRFLACGSVDDGKSTLIGHLIHLTGNLPDDQLNLLESESLRMGTAGDLLDYSLLLDGLMAEREQGITIDVAYRYFETTRRKFIVADTPGHESYTRNMATGASHCGAALILVDARKGVLPQTRRHTLICILMGIGNLLFAVNKMDQAGWEEGAFRHLEQECHRMVEDAALLAGSRGNLLVVPVSALMGDNLVSRSDRMPWYGGATVLEWLENVENDKTEVDTPFRLPVQYVLKGSRGGRDWQITGESGPVVRDGHAIWRSYAGSVVSGCVRAGDRVVILPSGVETAVEQLFDGERETDSAEAGMAISLVLAGEHDIVRGDCIAHPTDRPELAQLFKARLVWMDQQPLYAGRHYLFRSIFGTVNTQINRIRDCIGLDAYQLLAVDHLAQNDVGEVELSLARPLPFDPYGKNRATGAFILIDRLTNGTVACGMIQHPLRRGSNIHWQREELTRGSRAGIKGQKPCVIWFTGLSGSGKSTLANCLEEMLHKMGRHTMLLDGDNIRHGLNRDLGFTEADRIENIRRIGEVAKLMTDAGLIVITAFISPFRTDRDMVRALMPEREFIEIHLATPLDVCENRDPKGLYRKARRGEIPNLTGVSSPYEEPLRPELRLDTTSRSARECTDDIMVLLRQNGFC